MNYIKTIVKPDITLYPSLVVDENTELKYDNKNVKQTVKNLKLTSTTTIKGKGFKSTQKTVIDLKKGDILVFDNQDRGYIKPVEDMMTVNEAIEELKCIKEE